MTLKLNFKNTVFLFVMLLTSYSISAQSITEEESKMEISVEIDPATFAFNGYGIHLRIKPKNSDHLILGFGSYTMDFPSVLVDLNDKNEDMGWDVRLNQGYGLFGEYHFSETNKKWYVGTQLAFQEYKIQKDFYDGEAKYSTFMVMGLGGYTLQPFSFPLYFKFWGGLGYTDKISGDNNIGNAVYDVSPLLMFGALHIGYTF